MHDRIKRIQQSIAACEAKGKPTKALENQLKQLIREQQRQEGRQVKQAAYA